LVYCKSFKSSIAGQDPDGINIRIWIHSLETVLGLKMHAFFDADQDLGSKIFSTLDPESGI
jgi:hypothetical protein